MALTLGESLEQLWSNHVVLPAMGTSSDCQWQVRPLQETIAATFIRATHSRRQLLEVLVDFWHNHFNVYGWADNVAQTFVHYDRDVIRANALGNFRVLLEAVTRSPAMLYYLDNASSQAAGPNENFAREPAADGQAPADDTRLPVAVIGGA